MKLLGIFALLSIVLLADATVVIRHVRTDGEDTTTGCLRGSPPGDLWGPAVPGSNKLKCGAFGVDSDVAPMRQKLKLSDNLEVQLHLGEQHNGGSLTFEVTYGSNPNMLQNPGFLIGSTYTISPATSTQLFTNPLKNLKYAGKATVQVSFTPTNQEANESVTYYQCIDIEITDGEARLVPTEGYGDPDRDIYYAPAIEIKSSKNAC